MVHRERNWIFVTMDMLWLAVVAGLAGMFAVALWRVVVLRGQTERLQAERDALQMLAQREQASLREAIARTEADRHSAVLREEMQRQELSARLEQSHQSEESLRRQIANLRDALAEQDKRAAQAEAVLDERTATLERVQQELASAETALRTDRQKLAEIQRSYAVLQESQDAERRAAAEKLALLQDARAAMSRDFKLLASEIMQGHSETFTKLNREQVDVLLKPLRDRLGEFQQGLQQAQTESSRERTTLAEQIRALAEVSNKMTSETHNLTRALKGKAQTQGAWGEMILATILERSGLRPGEEYLTQQSHHDDSGARLRPDVIVRLPNEQQIILDSKVSLTAFEAMVNAASEEDRQQALQAHLQSVRTHIKTLGGKAYQSVAGSDLDYVIMFIPIEGAFAAAVQADPDLTSFAASQNVAITTPSTLMIALRTVASVWQVERRNNNAREIAERAGKLYDKFVGFAEDFVRLGKAIDDSRKIYDGAVGKLSLGAGNLIRQTEMLRDLGAKTSKTMPKQFSDGGPVALPEGEE